MQTKFYEEHPFAKYVRILGKGKNGSRSLTQQEAYAAMQIIMANEVEPEQLGAFMMLMRVKEETHEELTGFIQAVRDSFKFSITTKVDLDWSSYAGKRRYLPWFILAALTLAKNGIKVFMHGTKGHTNERIYTEQILPYLGIKPAKSLEESTEQLATTNFSYLPLQYLSPKLHEIIELRSLMGLRSPVHTLARMINPFNAPYMLQGIFHPGYSPVHQQAAFLLNQPHLAVMKGEGGEIERNPDMECLVQSVHNGHLSEEIWPPMFKRRHIKDNNMQLERLVALWKDEITDEYAHGAVIGTLAIAVQLLEKVNNINQAYEMAEQMWKTRDKLTIL